MNRRKLLLPILIIIMSVSVVKAQEPITARLCYEGRGHSQMSKDLASEIFIHEKAKVVMHNRTESAVFTLSVTEESIPQIGYSEIRVVLVNDASLISPYFFKRDWLTLDIYPLRNDIFYCKNYMPQELSRVNAKKIYDDIENDITKFLEQATAGDTLRLPSNLIDSRYTPLLIKNLLNNNEVYTEETMHGSGVKYTKFLGIKIKKENTGFSSTSYVPVRMSDLARHRLKEIFRPFYWNFAFPDNNASAEEWQNWLDRLLNNNEDDGVAKDTN